MILVYGIKNCDTVKKAVAWLKEHNLEHTFYDVKTCGLTLKQIDAWRTLLGPETLINKRSTTWKQLTPEEQTRVLQPQGLALVLANPTLIKRPLIEFNEHTLVGFNEEEYAKVFAI
jgi:arsenate reductase